MNFILDELVEAVAPVVELSEHLASDEGSARRRGGAPASPPVAVGSPELDDAAVLDLGREPETDVLAELEAELDAELDDGAVTALPAVQGSPPKDRMIEMSAGQLERLQTELAAFRAASASSNDNETVDCVECGTKLSVPSGAPRFACGKCTTINTAPGFRNPITAGTRAAVGPEKAGDEKSSDTKSDDGKSSLFSASKRKQLWGKFSDLRSKNKKGSDEPPPVPAAEHEAELAKARAETSQLHQELTLHNEMKEQLSRELKSVTADLNDQRAAFKSQLSTLSQKNTELRSKLESREQSYTKLATSVQRSRDRAAASDSASEIGTASAATDGFTDSADATPERGDESSAVAAEEAVQAAEAELELTKIKLDRTAAEVAELAADAESLRAQLRTAQHAMTEASKARESAEIENAELGTELETRNAELAGSVAKIAELESSLSSSRAATKAAEAATKSEREKVTELAGELAAARQAATAAAADHLRIRKDQQDTIDLLRSSQKGDKGILSELSADRDNLAAELAVARAAADEARTERDLTEIALAAAVAGRDEATESSKIEAASSAAARASAKEIATELSAAQSKIALLEGIEKELADVHAAAEVAKRETAMMAEASQKTAMLLEVAQVEGKERAAELSDIHVKFAAANTTAKHALAEAAAKLEAKTIELASANAKAAQLVADLASLEASAATNAAELDRVKEEASAAAMRLEAAEDQAATVTRLLEDAQAQRKLDHKKSAKSIRDITRQLQKEQLRGTGSAGGGGGVSGTSSSAPIETGSAMPLTRSASELSIPKTPNNHRNRELGRGSTTSTGSVGGNGTRRSGAEFFGGHRSPDRGYLGSNAATRERLQFIESHNEELQIELKKKTKLIQNFLLREQHGRMAPARNHEAERSPSKAKSSGLKSMVSALGITRDEKHKGGMTLETAMEANSTLQKVLEDTLLKNMQLQDSLDVISLQLKSTGPPG